MLMHTLYDFLIAISLKLELWAESIDCILEQVIYDVVVFNVKFREEQIDLVLDGFIFIEKEH